MTGSVASCVAGNVVLLLEGAIFEGRCQHVKICTLAHDAYACLCLANLSLSAMQSCSPGRKHSVALTHCEGVGMRLGEKR